MTAAEVRSVFLEFFRSRGHEIVKSSSLIPKNDPTLLFTNAGMVQFKSVFLGEEKRSYDRAVTSQKCMRAGGKHNDLENVGHTARHHTFFEMLGNFSFGDYFKEDAIKYSWELLTEHYHLPKDKLWVSIFEEDDEAGKLWKEHTDISPDRIIRLGAKDNFWQMGDTGPCGPCSEILIDQGSEVGCGRQGCAVGCECDRFLELWNLVFMQYNRDATGNLSPLPKPSIDTGMGLERISAVLQGKLNNFDSDLFEPIILNISAFSKKIYGLDRETDIAIRVIADHIRTITFLLSEGLIPSNDGRGYVLRRIIRRAARYSKTLGIEEPVLYKLCDAVADAMSDVYPELLETKAVSGKILKLEEERFNKTLEQGLHIINNLIKDLKASAKPLIPGDELFKLYDTYGFPLDIARDVAGEKGLRIDEAGFHREMEAQKTRARASWTGEETAVPAVYRELLKNNQPTDFVGYETMESGAKVLAIIKKSILHDEIQAGDEAEILLDKTPFYAESGGQAGDTGEIFSENMRAVVVDTKKPLEGIFIHKVKIKSGELKKDAVIHCIVNEQNRAATKRNHTATHMLHSSLRNVLGEHVKQAGSYVSPERLRFDFAHFYSLDQGTIDSIEDEINGNILKNIKVDTTVMDTKTAIDSGVTALFGEKYGDKVRVVTIPEVSSELCGGTHISATGDIGIFKILSEGSVASGIRRIEAITGKEAFEYLRNEEKELKKVSGLLKVADNPFDKLTKVFSEIKDLERELEKFKGKASSENSVQILAKVRTIDDIKVIAQRIDGMDINDLRNLADSVRDGIGSGVILLASVKDGQASMLSMVTKDLTKTFKAGDILKKVAAAAGGKGGGKPELAQGGTKDIDKLDSALEMVYEIVKK